MQDVIHTVLGKSKWDLNRDLSIFWEMVRQFLGVIRHERLGFDSIRYLL